MEKIGVGIITYKRPQYFKKLMATIPFEKIDCVVVVNDDPTAEPCDCPDKQYHEIINEENYGVGISKNRALKYLIDQGCTHLFLIEDDIEILDPNVFDVYIRTAKRSGIHHLSFGHVGGPLRKQIKGTREYIDGTGIQMYQNPQGSFCYYLANLIQKVGYLDENYKNAFEHVDHEYQLIKAGLLPAFWWFPDVKDSHKYVTITPGGAINSVITDKDGYNENYIKSAKYFTEKWGHFTSNIDDVSKNYVEQRLNFIENNYSRKHELNDDKKCAMIICYRNREQHLADNTPILKEFLNKHNPNNKIFIIEQEEGKLFNRGKLFNVGADIAKNEGYDYFIFHDVDMKPIVTDYGYPTLPTHLAVKVQQFNWNLPYETYYGGVFSISAEDYFKINGYNNDFWGWGKEDDDFWCRFHVQYQQNGIPEGKIWSGVSTSRLFYATYESLPHQPVVANPNWVAETKYNEKNDLAKKFENSELDYQKFGVNQVEYKIIEEQKTDNYIKYKVSI